MPAVGQQRHVLLVFARRCKKHNPFSITVLTVCPRSSTRLTGLQHIRKLTFRTCVCAQAILVRRDSGNHSEGYWKGNGNSISVYIQMRVGKYINA